MRDKMAISAYVFKKRRKGPILRPQLRELRILPVDGVFEILFEMYLQ